MAFPISMCYTNQLKPVVTSENQLQILNFIATSILKDKAGRVVIGDMQVKYKGSTSNWRGSLFNGVNNGVFTLIYKDDNWWLNYQLNMRELFIGTAILSGIMGVFSLVTGGPWWAVIFAFLWLCGGNWVIIVIRHGGLAADITLGIDELICGKTELPEDDRMTGELKSWF